MINVSNVEDARVLLRALNENTLENFSKFEFSVPECAELVENYINAFNSVFIENSRKDEKLLNVLITIDDLYRFIEEYMKMDSVERYILKMTIFRIDGILAVIDDLVDYREESYVDEYVEYFRVRGYDTSFLEINKSSLFTRGANTRISKLRKLRAIVRLTVNGFISKEQNQTALSI